MLPSCKHSPISTLELTRTASQTDKQKGFVTHPRTSGHPSCMRHCSDCRQRWVVGPPAAGLSHTIVQVTLVDTSRVSSYVLVLLRKLRSLPDADKLLPWLPAWCRRLLLHSASSYSRRAPPVHKQVSRMQGLKPTGSCYRHHFVYNFQNRAYIRQSSERRSRRSTNLQLHSQSCSLNEAQGGITCLDLTTRGALPLIFRSRHHHLWLT
jgi:hypothetical protein